MIGQPLNGWLIAANLPTKTFVFNKKSNHHCTCNLLCVAWSEWVQKNSSSHATLELLVFASLRVSSKGILRGTVLAYSCKCDSLVGSSVATLSAWQLWLLHWGKNASRRPLSTFKQKNRFLFSICVGPDLNQKLVSPSLSLQNWFSMHCTVINMTQKLRELSLNKWCYSWSHNCWVSILHTGCIHNRQMHQMSARPITAAINIQQARKT